jgi:hypothetical protein
LVGDDAIMGVGAGLAPDTLSLSVVVGIGASFIFNMGTDAVAAVSEKAMNSQGVKHVAYKIKGGVVKGANAVANEKNKTLIKSPTGSVTYIGRNGI